MIEFRLNRQEERDGLLDEKYYLWRFVDLHKLLHFLINQEIIFSRIDCFDDPLEGLSLNQIEHLDHLTLLPNKKTINPQLGIDIIREMLGEKKALPSLTKQYQRNQKIQFASCWYKKDSQSWAMWNQYSNNEGFAIKINGRQLLERLSLALNLYHFKNKNVSDAMIGNIDYLPLWPFNREIMYEYDTPGLYSGFKKDLSYSHENELRLIIVLNKVIKNKFLPLKMPLDDDLDIKIISNPKMDRWKFETVKSLINKLNIDLNLVARSELAFRDI